MTPFRTLRTWLALFHGSGTARELAPWCSCFLPGSSPLDASFALWPVRAGHRHAMARTIEGCIHRACNLRCARWNSQSHFHINLFSSMNLRADRNSLSGTRPGSGSGRWDRPARGRRTRREGDRFHSPFASNVDDPVERIQPPVWTHGNVAGVHHWQRPRPVPTLRLADIGVRVPPPSCSLPGDSMAEAALERCQRSCDVARRVCAARRWLARPFGVGRSLARGPRSKRILDWTPPPDRLPGRVARLPVPPSATGTSLPREVRARGSEAVTGN